jgi:hypothetical protein
VIVEGLPHTQAAVPLATHMHAGESRAHGTRSVLHRLQVAKRLYLAGAPDHLLAAGAMHDLIEKTAMSASEPRERFRARITELVLAVSDDGRIAGYAKRKAALRRQLPSAGGGALTLFAADKPSKFGELRREAALDPGPASATAGAARASRARRVRHYQRSLALLEERLPDSSLAQELHDELAALSLERAMPGGWQP